MKKKKKKKNTFEFNIDNTIKSILLSDRSITPQNLKFNVLKEILKSKYMVPLFEKKTLNFKEVIYYYKKEILQDVSLEEPIYYLNILEDIQRKRISTILENNSIDFTIKKMKEKLYDKDIEENWIDRNYTHVKITNGIIKVKIEDNRQLKYMIKMLEVDILKNIYTKDIIIDKNNLEKWLMDLKSFSLSKYNKPPNINENIIFVGQNNEKVEKCYLYYNISIGKIHIIYRTENLIN